MKIETDYQTLITTITTTLKEISDNTIKTPKLGKEAQVTPYAGLYGYFPELPPYLDTIVLQELLNED